MEIILNMVYKIKIYLIKSFKKIVVICDEEFYNSLMSDLSNKDVEFLNVKDIIINKNSIKKIIVKTIENTK